MQECLFFILWYEGGWSVNDLESFLRAEKGQRRPLTLTHRERYKRRMIDGRGISSERLQKRYFRTTLLNYHHKAKFGSEPHTLQGCCSPTEMMRKVQIKLSSLIKTLQLHPTLHIFSGTRCSNDWVIMTEKTGVTGATFLKSCLRSDLISDLNLSGVYCAVHWGRTLCVLYFGLNGLGPQCKWEWFWYAIEWTSRGTESTSWNGPQQPLNVQ